MGTVLVSSAAATTRTVLDFINEAQQEIRNAQKQFSENLLRRAMVRALSRLSSHRTGFTEGKFNFDTVAETDEYDSDVVVSGTFPTDAQDFLVVELDANDGIRRTLQHRSISEIRELNRNYVSLPTSSAYPRLFTWHAQKLVLAPPPDADGYTVYGWYNKDAKRDEASGALITDDESSDGYTNPWFNEGYDALISKTLEIYHKIFAIDQERSALYRLEFEEAEQSFRYQKSRRGHASIRVKGHL